MLTYANMIETSWLCLVILNSGSNSRSAHLNYFFVSRYVRWHQPAKALINNFYFKPLPETLGCTSMNACNYNPDATKDDGSCKPAKDGFDCKGTKLDAGPDGTFFIRTAKPMPLVKSLSHAEVDLPENFEVGFEITPQKTPLKSWSNIIHFTATGKVM